MFNLSFLASLSTWESLLVILGMTILPLIVVYRLTNFLYALYRDYLKPRFNQGGQEPKSPAGPQPRGKAKGRKRSRR